jgi:hypothetical protein
MGCFIRAAIPLRGTYAISYRSSHEHSIANIEVFLCQLKGPDGESGFGTDFRNKGAPMTQYQSLEFSLKLSFRLITLHHPLIHKELKEGGLIKNDPLQKRLIKDVIDRNNLNFTFHI